MKTCPVNVSEEAQKYLAGLVLEQGDTVDGVMLFVLNPGTAKAEVCLAFSRLNASEKKVIAYELSDITLYIEEKSEPFLDEARIDFVHEGPQKNITIKAPHSRAPKLSENSTLEERIGYFLATEINPDLALHGGDVSLVKIEDNTAFVRFGGGCQGCSMVDMTLKQGVEKQLLVNFKDLEAIIDITDHEAGTEGYY